MKHRNHRIAAACLLAGLATTAAQAQTWVAQDGAEQAKEQQVRIQVQDLHAQAKAQHAEATERYAKAKEQHAVMLAQAGEAHARFIAEDMAFAAHELGGERVVKGAPYCAEATHETIQPLADGNRIYRKQTSKLCRDGEGRTRQEVERNGKRSIFLNDPVAKEHWVLDPEAKTARNLRIAINRDFNFNFGDGASWQGIGDKVQERVREITKRIGEPGAPRAELPKAPEAAQPAPPTPAVISRTESTDDKGRTRRDVEVRVIRTGDGQTITTVPPVPGVPGTPMVAPVPPVPPMVQLRALNLAPRGPGVASSLGTKDVEGVKANGEKTTWTVEAGKMGNEKPMVTTREVWTSPDLMLTVSSRDFDPRSGEVNYKLHNIKRGEPDANLFKVPADYEKPRMKAPAASKG
ncbi:hypothetical protein [Pelomonas sp. SE-A7]|uniref:hypothetical protein n=1 Tax=Pelomonas sp. SE-A7 TaxID=3054953 RepID=UPI00259D0EAF|nr:hypothetical protein [Pelomonas sp. SE-A7]MDM4766515.1 hypothetical protein [Pelomonas sp. SE-A7]